ncbi:MAG: hypothetical protein AAGA54_15755 [Myxococcota bacterium]
MRLSTIVWFSTGCGLALLSLVAGRAVVDSIHDAQAQAAVTEASADASAEASLLATPAPDHSVPLSEVPIQRPRHLREMPPVAPPPPLPSALDDVASVDGRGWSPDDARLPSAASDEPAWNPDDARLPQAPVVIAVARAMWNPDSAALPSGAVGWDPDDARLP